MISKPLVNKKKFKQRIVICGSMSFYGDMLAIQKCLEDEGIPAVVPEPEDQYIGSMSEEDFASFKRAVSYKYLKVIRAPETVAVLAVNKDKHGVSDYIGPNTFAEIAVAFAQRKKVFLLQGVPESYVDELVAWEVIPLDGELMEIQKYYRAETEPGIRQLDMFEDVTHDGSD